MSVLNVPMGEGSDFSGIVLRKPKLGNGGIGGGGKKNVNEMKRSGYLKHQSTTNKRGREESVLKVLKILIIQEYHEAGSGTLRELRARQLDHIFLRNAEGFEPLGAMLSPLNLQLISDEQHKAKTNAPTLEGQRMDYRNTAEQERMTDLTKRLIRKLGKIWNLKDLKTAIVGEIYEHSEDCGVCGSEDPSDCADEGEAAE